MLMAMTQGQPWFDRTFEFTFPIERYPNICARLRGTPARLEEISRDCAAALLVRKPDGKWSAQEHAGHLADLEPLWMARVNDFVSGKSALSVADLRNQKTDQANHNSRSIIEILKEFRTARSQLGRSARAGVVFAHAAASALDAADAAGRSPVLCGGTR